MRGLNYGRACPDCATPIEPAGIDDILLTGDASTRHAWRIGFAIAFLCLVGAVGARLTLFVLGFRGLSDATAWTYLDFGLVLSCLWVIAAWLLTPAVLGVRFMFMGTLRWVVRFSQLLWPLGYMCWMTGVSDSSDRWIMWGRLLRLGAGVAAADPDAAAASVPVELAVDLSRSARNAPAAVGVDDDALRPGRR